MSYYTNPYFAAYPQHQHPVHRQAPGQVFPQPPYNFFSAPPPTIAHPHFAPPAPAPSQYDLYGINPVVDDYEAEERAALAHLRAIQRRREEAERRREESEAAIAREAAIRAKVQAEREREAAILARVQAEQEAALVRERERQQAIARAIEQERRAKLAAIEKEKAKQQQRQQTFAAYRDAAIRHAIRRSQEAFAQRKEQLEEQAAQRKEQAAQRKEQLAEQIAQRKEQLARRKQQCLDRCSRSAPPAKNDLADINNVLQALFGISLEAPSEVQRPETPAPKPVETKTIQPTPALEPEAQPKTEKVVPKAAEKPIEPAFPEDINSLLNHFLGLRVEPASNDTPKATTKGVPAGLNEFLSQFGLTFEPTEDAESNPSNQATGSTPVEKNDTAPATASSSKPVTETQTEPAKVDAPKPRTSEASSSSVKPSASPAPLTSFLNEVTDLPPFVRDILSNVEVAFQEHRKTKTESSETSQAEAEVQGKGKGVAAGEKPALDKLNSIAHDLDLAKASFTFPDRLSFSTADPSESAPSLPFNRTNRPYHSQTNKLLQLLLQADGITSGGNREVRNKRKEVVRAVEGAIEELEKKRDAVWAEVKERRERGESDEEDEVSSASSIAGEHHEESTAPEESTAHEQEHHEEIHRKPTPVTVEEVEDESEGYQVPAPVSVPATTPASEPTKDTDTPVEIKESSTAEEEPTVVEPESESTPTSSEQVKEVEHVEDVQQDTTAATTNDDEGDKADKKSVDAVEKEDGYEIL